MADNKQGFWPYMWEEFKDTFYPSSIYRKTANLIAGKPLDYEEPKYTGDTSVTLNDVAMNSAQNTGPFVQNPDLTAPQNDLGTNSVGGQTDIDLTSGPTLAEVAQNSNNYSHMNILENIDLDSKEKVKENEDLITDESKGSWRQRTRKGVSNFFKGWRDIATDQTAASLIDIERTKAQKYAAVGFNEDNGNIIRLVINEGQGLTDDFHDTLFSVGEGNQRVFEDLYYEYKQNNELIENSGLDEYTIALLEEENRANFKKEVEDRNLIKLHEDDYYSNNNGWFYPNMVAANMLSGKGFFDSFDVLDRRKNQFTKEELDTLAKTGIKSANDKFELSDNMFDSFLEAYESNLEVDRNASIGASDTAKVRYTLTEESLAEMESMEKHKVYDGVWSQLTTLVDNGTISQDEANDIMQNSYSGVVDYLLDQMHLWMDPSLAYYAVVKNKDYSDLTQGEKAILGYGPGMLKLMDDMTDAIAQRLEESIKQGIKDGRLSETLEQINGMSINDFFKNAIRESNIQAGGTDLTVRDSAVDAMQLINQNIAYLYWKDKGSLLRQAKTEGGRWLGAYGYTGGELFQDLTVGALRLFGADKLADYTLADATKLMELTTDTSLLGNENRGRLIKKYGLAALENLPEFYGVYKSFSPLTKVGRAGGSYKTFERIKKMKDGVKKTKELQKYYQTIKKGIGTVAENGSKGWLSRMNAAMVDKLGPTGQAIANKGLDVIKGGLADQGIDMIAGYYDTENYSVPSYLLSVGLTGAFEIFPRMFLDTEALKIFKNVLTPGRSALDNTGWRLMDTVMSNEELMKKWTNRYGLDYDTFRKLNSAGMGESLDDVLRASYEALDEGGKAAVRRFSKQEAIDTINSIMDIDWQSSYGRNLARILNNNQTNGLDIWKYVLGIPGKIEYGGLQSSIVFKEGKEAQTRYLLSEYDKQLDKIDGQFRRKLSAGFTEENIRQIADRTDFKDVLDKGKVNGKYFIKDGDKYLLNTEGADYLGLKVSNYTDAMRKADVLRAQSAGAENEIFEMLANLNRGRGISEDTVTALAQSGAYKRMVDTFSVFC